MKKLAPEDLKFHNVEILKESIRCDLEILNFGIKIRQLYFSRQKYESDQDEHLMRSSLSPKEIIFELGLEKLIMAELLLRTKQMRNSLREGL